MSRKNENLTQKFAEGLLERRQQVGLTQAELARKIGVSLRTVQNWEGRKNLPKGKDMRTLYAVLQFTPERLFGSGPPVPPAMAEAWPNRPDRDSDHPTAESLGARLRAKRSKPHLPAEEIARQLGVEPGVVQGWLNGQAVPAPGMIRRLCDILRISPRELLGGKVGARALEHALAGAGDTPLNQGMNPEPSAGRTERGQKRAEAALHDLSTGCPSEEDCRAYFERFLRACAGSPRRLAWTMEELETHFPLSRWPGRA